MTLFDVFDRLELSGLGHAIRDSTWLFPAIEAVHLLGLSLLGGAVILVDVRLLGLGLTGRTIAYVEQAASRWLAIALVALAATGVPLFLSEAVKCYFSQAFWVKMIALVGALAFTYIVRRPVARSSGATSRLRHKLTALASLGLWFTVAGAGRWIGFS